MSKKSKSQEEGRFLRGETGVDGLEVVEEIDEEAQEKGSAKEQLFRSRTWLGREFLTWLLWRSESTEPLCQHEGEPVSVIFSDRMILKGIKGEVTEVSLKGKQSPYSSECKYGLSQGLLVHTARLVLTVGERAWEATIDAENLDIRSGKIPQLLTEEDDDRRTERIDLTERLSDMIDALVGVFLEIRTRPTWRKQIVPQMQSWMREDEDVPAQRMKKGA